MSHKQQKYFRHDYSQCELSIWVNEFAAQFECSKLFCENAKKLAKNFLDREFEDNSISVCLEINTSEESPIRIIESHKVSLDHKEREISLQRKLLEKLLNRHPKLQLINSGSAGRIHFEVIPSKEEGISETIRFVDLERAPVIDIYKRKFRQSFPLAMDYRLLENTLLFGDSPIEEVLLFAHRALYDQKPLRAVVSLLHPHYTATAFRVSPNGGYITCYHNLYLNDKTPVIEKLWMYDGVVSKSYAFVGSLRKEVEFVSCELPVLDERDPVDDIEPLRISLPHSDIAFLRSSPGEHFLIPYSQELSIGEEVVCVGYPGDIDSNMIREAYSDISMQELIPDKEEYLELFTPGNLSISPGPVIARNSSAIACEVATVPGFSGSPVCLLKNPRMFVGIHYRARSGKNYALSISVKDKGFYHLYSTLVVPTLREIKNNLCEEDVDAINDYLRIGETPLL